jgi:hypothetical protein
MKSKAMKIIFKSLLILGLALVAGGCATTGSDSTSSSAPTVSGYISTGASTTIR